MILWLIFSTVAGVETESLEQKAAGIANIAKLKIDMAARNNYCYYYYHYY